jgi:sulfoxide reductase heme-binding subunit YedZ
MALDLILWETIRAAGVLAFALLTMSVLLGLSVRSRVTDPLVHRGWIYEFHQTLSVAGLVTIVGHVALILMNRHVHFGLGGVLVPVASEWRPWPQAPVSWGFI